MYKILTFGMTDNYGGVESVIMNYYRNFNHNKIQMDFLVTTSSEIAYSSEIKKYKGRIFSVPSRHNAPLAYFKKIREFFKIHAKEYDCFWVNMNNLVNIDYLKLAKKYGIKRIIIHAHNTQLMETGIKGEVKKFFHEYNRKKIKKYVTDFWACSQEAANWFYEKDSLPKVRIIKNALMEEKYFYNKIDRQDIRKRYNLENMTVIGNIGRLNYQKNQSFLLDIFKQYLLIDRNAKLLLIGKGEEKRALEEKAQRLNISSHVIFLGMKKNIKAWYSAFDVFVFPSHFEGLGIVLLEAQANGVPILATKGTIPTDVKVNDNLEFISLSDSPKYWSQKAKKCIDDHMRITNKKTIITNFQRNNYDIKLEAKKVEKLFLNNIN
ncbi:glycosyltransferase [Lactobacillus amylovorus]|uniref:glycosyltransferase n=1 Tax=Lactobacillus amylovorus TaxID=1604 RepID=UPI00232FD86B|nr:glycosyltransferase [Lactobacillus amylovorus]MDB6234366.1 glycosyltransferase [Lactobacillus amylovorus]